MTQPAGITVDPEAIRLVVAKGLLEAIGPEQRDLMITAAVDHLLVEPETGPSYARVKGDSPLQVAFTTAVRQIANETIAQLVAEGPVRQAIDTAIREKVTAMLASEGGWLYSTVGFAVAERVEKIMRGDR